ncbi:uncharacterized protein TRUGW13939_06656 [Talaromyces rugulosus]|uniref:Nucleoside phosphorylase domain-containing protein n=1 Tax=Talaromyces rugulosus TaxID=121627 RepID=A0A7H8QZK7_TALRU|nr:uncharacterized protein TRUGW13939_06656 [Talaromyces rugulosus]QKX59522.1 hypothetical protein TRUGW13939_06656 [Talaromyces rugulosus]
MPPFSEYTIGWISALPLEMAAAMAVLDEDHGRPNQQPARDKNNYMLGRIGQHNVVIACLPAGVYGTTSAAVVAMDMVATFTHLRFSLMVGIGGGVPSIQYDIRLGDVVVGRPQGTAGGVIQYDRGKTTPGGHLNLSGSLNKPHPVLLTAVSGLHALHMKEGNRIPQILAEMAASQSQMDATFFSPGQEHDHLYAAEYAHPGSNSTCEHCDKEQLVQRPERKDSQPAVFYGTIASGNQVMKDGVTRDRLGRQLDVICFEMEAAGLMDHFPCLVIRGICDYADSHKNKAWQGYAAATAAAYAKELLCILPTTDIPPVPRLFPKAADQLSHPSFLATRDWYERDEIQLASLVPNIKYPNQDALVATSVKREEDVSICVDQALNEYFPVKPTPTDTSIVHLLSRVFALPDSQPAASHWRVQATESRTYMLRQPRTIFKQICAHSDVREWLEESFMESQPAYFIVGYRTALNAKLTWEDDDTNPRYISGERIYAICYRQISFRFLKGAESAFLAASNYWNLFSDGRGAGSNEDFLNVDIPDDDGDENWGMLV